MPKIPQFANDQEESAFWDTHDSTDYEAETAEIEMVLVDGRPRAGLVAVRLDPAAVDRVIALANSRNIGYRSLLAAWIMERLAAEVPVPPAAPRDADAPADRLRAVS